MRELIVALTQKQQNQARQIELLTGAVSVLNDTLDFHESSISLIEEDLDELEPVILSVQSRLGYVQQQTVGLTKLG